MTWFFSSPSQRQFELLPSLGVRRPLTFHILNSETAQPNEVRGEDFLEFDQSETGLACGVHVC
jgi:hypothetical protein